MSGTWINTVKLTSESGGVLSGVNVMVASWPLWRVQCAVVGVAWADNAAVDQSLCALKRHVTSTTVGGDGTRGLDSFCFPIFISCVTCAAHVWACYLGSEGVSQQVTGRKSGSQQLLPTVCLCSSGEWRKNSKKNSPVWVIQFDLPQHTHIQDTGKGDMSFSENE